MSTDTSLSSSQETPWFVSLLFWSVLLLAAGLFAAVSLAPRLLQRMELRQQYAQNQVELVALEDQIRYLERVTVALADEPEFQAQVARMDFDTESAGESLRISVTGPLCLDADYSMPRSAQAASLPWYSPVVRTVAENKRLRQRALLAAAVLIVMAFTFLHDAEAPRLHSATQTLTGWLRQRYGSTPDHEPFGE